MSREAEIDRRAAQIYALIVTRAATQEHISELQHLIAERVRRMRRN